MIRIFRLLIGLIINNFDIINVTLTFALIAIVQYRYKLRFPIILLLLFHFSLIFLTNNVLFNPGYMPDQFKYLRVAQAVRGSGESIAEAMWNPQVAAAGIIFGLFPIPIINSIYSIAIINFLLYLFLFLFLYEREVLKGFSLWAFLLYPSLLFYTSLSLRDTLVLVIMVLSFWFIVRNKILIAIVIQLPLAVLKFQNLAIFALSLLTYILLSIFFPKISHKKMPPGIVYVFLLVFIAAAPFAYKYGLTGLNFYRHWMWCEDTGIWISVIPETQIKNLGELITETIKSTPYFLFKPFPWQAENLFQLVQSGENLLIGAIIFYLIWRAFRYKVRTPPMNFLLLYFIVSLAVYGLVIWNFGTAVRYKFPFITLFIVFYSRLFDFEAEKRLDYLANERL
ncbi:hypothetical protein ES705_32340 [subsurface metagenome]